jgi:predicted esterase
MVDPHGDRPVVTAGPPLGEGRTVMILVHGRNASPLNILDLAIRLDRPDVTCLAPSAAGHSWYPLSFMAERDKNEPGLSSGLAVLGALVDRVVSHGVATDRLVLAGFSQGACLAAEFTVRHPMRYGGLLGFSGGLIGPPGTTWDTPGSLAETPVFLGCSDVDSHIPKSRVEESADVFTRLGADVTMRLYPGMGHLVNDDEIAMARAIIDGVSA